jgi:hypothetical protein
MAPPADEEARALERLEVAGAAIVAGVEAELPAWVLHQVERILEAWGRCDATERARARADAEVAGIRATERVVGALRELFARDPARQRVTPLEIVRTAIREPTAVLTELGVAAVVRDDFEVRAWPHDPYGLVPRALSDLQCTEGSDRDLGTLQLVWGHALATVLRARSV